MNIEKKILSVSIKNAIFPHFHIQKWDNFHDSPMLHTYFYDLFIFQEGETYENIDYETPMYFNHNNLISSDEIMNLIQKN